MRCLTLVLLLFIPFTAHADDPPFLAAAKERQAKAKAFTATISYTKTWQQVKPFGSKEGTKDFTGRGHETITMNGGQYRLTAEYPELSVFGVVTLVRVDTTYDGIEIRFTRSQQTWDGRQIGPFRSTGGHVEKLTELQFQSIQCDPLRYVVRGFDCPLMRQDDPGQQINGVMCERYVGTQPGHTKRTLEAWLDPNNGYVPLRVVQSNGTPGDFTLEYSYGGVDRPAWAPNSWKLTRTKPLVQQGKLIVTEVRLDSFELKDAIPEERFRLSFPAGSRVTEVSGNKTIEHIVADDGTLTPVQAEEIQAEESPAQPRAELPSLSRTLWVVGGTVAVFIAFVVLVKWLARNRADESDRAYDAHNLPR